MKIGDTVKLKDDYKIDNEIVFHKGMKGIIRQESDFYFTIEIQENGTKMNYLTGKDTVEIMKIQTIKEQWEEFAKAVLPRNVGLIQREEMRRAFYTGFFACLMTNLDIANIDSEEVGASELGKLHEECRQFHKEMKNEN